MDSDSIPLLIILICVIMSAYFSATETAFSSFNKIRMKNLADKGNKKARLVMHLSENYDKMLSTILIGNNIVNILISSMATVLFLKWFGEEAGPSLSTIVVTIVVLIFGEITPKSIAKEYNAEFTVFSAPFLNVLIWALTPFNFLFSLWKNLLSKVFKPKEDDGITDEELLSIVEEAESHGNIDEQESQIIQNAIDFAEQEAGNILTPRIDISGVSTKDTKDNIALVFANTAYSRLPIYEDTIDHIVGIIYQKDFYNYVYHTDRDVSSIIKPVVFVPKSKKVGPLLKELQQKKLHIAVVVDEYGGTVGLVTLEDILEELVGEIWDEHDDVCQEIIKKSETESIILGVANIDDVFEYLDIDIKEDERNYTTLNGWIMELLGRIPEKGDVVEYENITMKVLRMDEKRVDKVQVFKKTKE